MSSRITPAVHVHNHLPYKRETDQLLLELAGRNDAAAYNEIYRRYRPRLLEIACSRLSCRHLAEDLVQDIFVSLYLKRERLEISVSLKAYLVQALKYKIANELRARRVRARYRQRVFSADLFKYDLAFRHEAKELVSRVRGILQQLPPRCREAFVLSRDLGKSHKDISACLNISVSTVEKHIVKALKVMRSNLDEYLLAG